MNMREEFEKWLSNCLGPFVDMSRDVDDGVYEWQDVRLAWLAWKAAQPEWIECSDRRPDIEGKFITDGTYGVGTSFFDPSWSNVFQDCASNNDEGMEDFEGRIFRVTRWMPLPNPPEE
ncbi:DUF551 domain-containing protein [Edwardsiella piscicida]|nr:DUF551 domain-containing protein [Edwardsiella piscicida]